MRRQYKNALVYFSLWSVTFAAGLFHVYQSTTLNQRMPAAASDWSAADFEKAHPAITSTEMTESKPDQGRSYFDQIFSDGQLYQVPFPFNRLLKKLSDYTGQPINAPDSSGIKATLFPMGRSLQRNAAITGTQQQFSYDPFFRFPRAVVGIDDETISPNEIRLNLKNKFYVGYNERAEILEVISFNDKAGRYEYQLVKNYAAGKKPEVLYANRSLCLSCHQNQTPIFSRGPWSESNANPFVQEKLQATFDQVFGKKNCQNPLDEPYCYLNNKAFYFGLPVKIDLSIPYRFDTSTDMGNLVHAHQKMWQKLCTTFECRSQILKASLIYLFSGQVGIIPDTEMKNEFIKLDNNFQNAFPHGLSIASPNIPNRDPLKDISESNHLNALQGLKALKDKTVQELLTLSKVPSEFEPLQIRPPIDIWKNSGFEINNTNRLIRAWADEFTKDDLKLIEKGLQFMKSNDRIVDQVQAQCEVTPDGQHLAVMCEKLNSNIKKFFQFQSYIKMNGASGSGTSGNGPFSEFKIVSDQLGCDEKLRSTDQNIFSGKSCPSAQDLMGSVTYNSERTVLNIRLYNQAGLTYHTLHGYDASQIQINLQTGEGLLTIYNSLQGVQSQMWPSLQSVLSEKNFSRFEFMKSLMQEMKMKDVLIEKDLSRSLPMKIDGDENVNLTEEQILNQLSGQQLMQKVCSSCHQNDDGVPPDFMGSKILPLSNKQQCERIDQCAARILYRLKMRQCENTSSQKKKNPMPPNLYFKNNPQAFENWMKTHNPKVIQYVQSLIDVNQLAQTLQSQGLPLYEAQMAAQDLVQSACPAANSVIYEQFPRCEFHQLNLSGRCR